MNAFGVVQPDGSWTLVGAAIPFSAGIIQRWAPQELALDFDRVAVPDNVKSDAA